MVRFEKWVALRKLGAYIVHFSVVNGARVLELNIDSR